MMGDMESESELGRSRGLGAIEAPEFVKLYSKENLSRTRALYGKIRGSFCFWTLISILGVALQALTSDSALSLVGEVAAPLIVLFAAYKMLQAPYRRLSLGSQRPGPSLLQGCVTGLAAWFGLCLLSGLVTYQIKSPPLAAMASLPLVVIFHVALWMLQFFPAVATLESRGLRQDLARSVQLIQGNHLELFLTYLVTGGLLQIFQICGYLGIWLTLGLPAAGLCWALGLQWPIWIPIVASIIFMCYSWLEIMCGCLALHTVLYWELRKRQEPIPEGQGLCE